MKCIFGTMKNLRRMWLLRSSFLIVGLTYGMLAAATEPLTFIEKTAEIEVKMVKGKPRTTLRVSETMAFHTDQAANYSSRAVYYGFFAKLTKIEAYSLVPDDKGKFKKVKVSNYRDYADVDDGIFIDDSRARDFNFPELKKGARGVLTYELQYDDPQAQPSFFFAGNLDIGLSRVVLRVQDGIDIDHRIFNGAGYDIRFTEGRKGKESIFQWELKDTRGIPNEDNSPSGRYYLPHLMYRVMGYTSGKEQVPFLHSPAGLYAHYYPYIAHIYEDDHRELQPLLDGILAGRTAPLEQTAAIYNWVQDNLKYVAFEEDYRGLRPYEPKRVIEARFGDCKDMSSVLYSLMHLAGLPVYLAWVGTRDLPYRYSDWPTNQVDNHMIAVYHAPDTTIFLDGTGMYTPFGYPTEMIQGKEVLIGLSKDSFQIVEVPMLPPRMSTSVDTIRMKWNGSYIEGNGRAALTGYLKSRYTYRFEHADADDQRKRLSGMLQWGNNAFSVSAVQYKNDIRNSSPLYLDFAFNIKEYALQLQDELIVNLNLDKSMLQLRVDLEKRQAPIYFEFANTADKIIFFEIPDGYEVAKLPESRSFRQAGMEYTIAYAQEDGQIVSHQRMVMHSTWVGPEALADYNGFLDQLRNVYKQAITLKKVQ